LYIKEDIDINGDGLPDYFNGSGFWLNTGGEFSSGAEHTVGEISVSDTKSLGVSASISKGKTLKVQVRGRILRQGGKRVLRV
jgi:hypothetical protein